MRTIAVVTVARSDFGILLPLLKAIQADSELRLHLLVTGAHLASEFGEKLADIEKEGLRIGERIDMLLAADTPAAVAKSMGLGVLGFAQAFDRKRPDLLVVMGDRFEMMAAATAAVPFQIPIAHIHGGEVTVGAIDDAFRHAITKFSHLHFTATEEYAVRVRQLGEEPWRITVSGAPSLDNLQTVSLLTKGELQQRTGLSFDQPPLLVTYHPVTLQYDQAERQTQELLAALANQPQPILFTRPNADPAGRQIAQLIEAFVKKHPAARLVDNLGTQAYFSVMRHAAAMVGNSSSGFIEAASFGLPVVNIGIRQQGRACGRNVVHCDCRRAAISAAIEEATSPAFRAALAGLENIYGTGEATDLILERLKSIELNETLTLKRFADQQPSPARELLAGVA